MRRPLGEDVIRVLVADDHHLVRNSLEQLLGSAPGIDVVGTAADGEEAVALADELRPDVVLMDLSMPRTDGVAATKRIVTASPGARVVMLSSFTDDDRIVAAIDAGAIGYMLKDSDPADLVDGVRAAARDESPLDPRVARAVIASRSDRSRPLQLSQREREILVLICEGLLNKQIARRLEISEKTVKAHLTSAFQRIGVTDRTQAALWARRNGLISEP